MTSLGDLGLGDGAEVRFRRRDGGRWHVGVAERVERDGSLRVRDRKGAARAIPITLVEVSRRGPRGGTVWVPLTTVAATTEQLRLL